MILVENLSICTIIVIRRMRHQTLYLNILYMRTRILDFLKENAKYKLWFQFWFNQNILTLMKSSSKFRDDITYPNINQAHQFCTKLFANNYTATYS